MVSAARLDGQTLTGLTRSEGKTFSFSHCVRGVSSDDARRVVPRSNLFL